jgi:hypothetical protein
MLGFVDEKIVAFAIMQFLPQLKTLYIISVYAPSHLKTFLNRFDDWCRSIGVEKYSSISSSNPQTYERLLNTKIQFSVFTKEL